ncbi:MAG: hypothetical protein RKP20_03615 [Candidatus Competibacter sp.]|nr:hypothetical protein [Candidatus Competibacter sp.]
MIQNLVRFPTTCRAAIGPDIHQPLLRALCEHTDGEGLPVGLCYEPNPPDDHPAIAILLDSRNLCRLLGAAPATVGDRQRRAGDCWRLGAIHPADPGRDALQARIADRDVPLPACLDWTHHAWRVRVYAPDPDAGDCDIVF